MRFSAMGRFVLLAASLCLILFAGTFAVVSVSLNMTRAAAPNSISRAFPATGTASDWSEFHGDAARDGNAGSDTHLSKANITSLVPVTGAAYTNTTGSSEGSPVIYQGFLYYIGNTVVTKGTSTLHVSTVYSVNLKNGTVSWSKQFPACGTFAKKEWTSSTPAVTTGMVNGVATPELFVGWGSQGQGCIYDFNAQNGALIWTFNTTNPVNSSPAIMSTNNGNIVVVGDNAFYIHSFSVDFTGTRGGTATQLWQYDTRTDVPPSGSSGYCLSAPVNCGDSIWSSPAEGMVSINGVTHHYAYFGLGAEANTVGRVDAIDLDTFANNSPALAWSFWDPHAHFDDDFGTILALTDTNGFAIRVYSGENNGDVFGLDAVTGAMYFDFNPASQLTGGATTKTHSTGALVTINGVTELIFGSGCSSSSLCGGPFGYIWAVDALSTNPNGTFLWKSENFGNDIVSSPVVVNQGSNAVVLVMGPWKTGATGRGDLLALNPTNGALLADYSVYSHSYGTISSPAVSSGTVYVTEGFTAYGNTTPGVGALAAFQCTGC